MSKSAEAVKWMRAHPRVTQAQLAKRFGISRQAVSQALKRAGLGLPKDVTWQKAAAAVAPYHTGPPRFGIKVSSNVSGALTELMVCVDLMKRGFDVYRSVSPSGRCDVVAISRDTGAVNRVEVKCGKRNKSGQVVCQVGKHNSFDTLAVVVGSDEIVYDPPLISSE